jgi:serine/threonine protein phosphatase PrpC
MTVNAMTAQGEQHTTELELRFGQKSDRGPARELNEDYAHCLLPTDKAQLQAKGAVFLVADGMGGHRAGEVASQQAVERVLHEYCADASHEPGQSLVRAFKAANQVLYDWALSDTTKTGMGTTLVAAVILGRKVYVANVGDSRAYLVNRQGITRITEDHSWVEKQVRAGLLTREEAERHPQRNLITRALGSKPTVEVDLFEGELSEGDRLLLCTDGMSGPLSEQQIAHIVLSHPAARAAARLVALACAQRGDDNATALVVEALAPEKTLPAVAQPSAEPAEAPASGSFLDTIGRWLRRPGPLQIGEERQRLVVGLAAAAFLVCLCGVVALLPAAGQRLAGDPVEAPQLAPIRDERLDAREVGQLATFLGYASADDMLSANPGQFDPQQPVAKTLMPAQPGVFLVGSARNWSCDSRACTFELRMADKNYKVSYNQGEEGDRSSLRGRQVRVFGYQQREGETVTAQFIERGSRWWAWWQEAWTMVYQVHSWGQAVWVYGIVDRNPNGLLDTDDQPNVQRRDRVLLRGSWSVGERSAILTASEAYRLEGISYVPMTSKPVPIPQPTVTLMLTPQ